MPARPLPAAAAYSRASGQPDNTIVGDAELHYIIVLLASGILRHL